MKTTKTLRSQTNEQTAGTQTAWRPLGGAVMGRATSDLGQLYGHKNLFVVDGSLLPGSAAAANPSLTIAANAERTVERLVRHLDGDCD